MNKIIRVVLVEPRKKAVIKTINGSLENMQKIVGGYIEAIALDDKNTLIYNEEGRIRNLPFCRALVDDRKIVRNVIAGTFFICAREGTEYASLDDNSAKKYQEQFLLPEALQKIGGKYVISRFDPEKKGGTSV